MGFNAHHHDGDMMARSSSDHRTMQMNNATHHFSEMGSQNSNGNNDDCCKNKVTTLATADKSLPQSYAVVNPVFFASFIATFYEADIFHVQSESTSFKYFVRSAPPSKPDIRIAIQSFLI